MNNADLVRNLEHLADSSKMLDQLLRLPRERVDQLIRLLSSPEAVGAVVRLLHTVRELQSGERSSGLLATSMTEPDLLRSMDHTRLLWGRDTSDGLRAVLEHLFKDRERFPTTKSIAEFVANAFKVQVPYQRLNRERYIRKVVDSVRKSPRALHHVRNSIMHGKADTKDAAYATLYNFIRGRLTDE